ncbi:hypothetical protein FF905_02370 [Bordetella pertussis]|uniref:hypothetical protein n=2 Tax=Bordetella pertussis TaxID=520 RepID=UPI0003D3C020|nr:hypothetical protein EHO96_06935 [Bordetella pertussis]ETH84990.1 hypothetical protein L559_2935 [Bordetella pertussis STO1-CHOC-0017]ETH88586.1 hypothetical protein L560_0460 [Bordetella pertussis STO1-CHOC-0018]AZI28382.1 hypothetical protein EHO76_01795 [Bordetella pertussis]PAX93314.1 hypothetical protein CKW47_18335 [Bordetella pertussis]
MRGFFEICCHCWLLVERLHLLSLSQASCEDSIGCMHGSSEPDLRNWKSPTPQFTQGARPDEHP